jgi:hypothetical protein
MYCSCGVIIERPESGEGAVGEGTGTGTGTGVLYLSYYCALDVYMRT